MDVTGCVCVNGLLSGHETVSEYFEDCRKNKWKLRFARDSYGMIAISLMSSDVKYTEMHIYLNINSECVLDDWFIFQSNMFRYLHTTNCEFMQINIRAEYRSAKSIQYHTINEVPLRVTESPATPWDVGLP